MKTTVTLDSKDVRAIIAKFLNISIEDVIPNRYSFSIVNMSANAIEQKIKGTVYRDECPNSICSNH